jgi:adenylate kinase family enzyme
MQRISVVGNSGSGKTTVAQAIAAELSLPCLELDGVFHQPDWRPLDSEEFRRIVSEFTVAEGWVVDGGYSAVSDIVWGRADTVIWVDPPRYPENAHLTFVRLRTPEETAALLGVLLLAAAWRARHLQWPPPVPPTQPLPDP